MFDNKDKKPIDSNTVVLYISYTLIAIIMLLTISFTLKLEYDKHVRLERFSEEVEEHEKELKKKLALLEQEKIEAEKTFKGITYNATDYIEGLSNVQYNGIIFSSYGKDTLVLSIEGVQNYFALQEKSELTLQGKKVVIRQGKDNLNQIRVQVDNEGG